MTDTELYSELRFVITDIVNEFVKGGGDPNVARRMAFDAARSVDYDEHAENKPSAKLTNLS